MGKEWTWSRSFRRGEREKETPTGCMSSVLQLFDLHQFLFRTTTTAHSRTEGDLLPHDRQVTSPRGVVAPRNSLELDEASVSSASAVTGEEEYGNIPIGVQLFTEKKMLLAPLAHELEEGRSSQGTKATKTGNVVARLMGLDKMPDREAPRASAGYYSHELQTPLTVRSHQQRKTHHRDASRRETAVTPPPRRPLQPRNCNILVIPEDGRHGTRSLPDTPRMSSARRSWDTDPRLSLQLSYKENAPSSAAKDLRCLCDVPGGYSSVSLSPLFVKSKRKAFAQQVDENRSPSLYAQEIMKLVKENVARRITGRDCDDPLRRPKGATARCSERKTTGDDLNPDRTSTAPSCSPRLRLVDSPKKKPVVLGTDDTVIRSSSPRLLCPSPSPPTPRPSPPSLPASDREISTKVAIKLPASAVKGKKSRSERFMERIRKPSVAAAAREESFVSPPSSTQPRRKCGSSIPAFVPGIRKKTPTSPPQPPEPQTHVPPMLRQISDQLLKCGDGSSRERSNSSASAGLEEYQYVRCILERTGLQCLPLLPFATVSWYSPSHPVDPILFHQLERSFNTSYGPLRHRCNRKLLFHLVDEVLADLLWPVLHATAWPRSNNSTKALRRAIPDGEALMQRLWSQIRSYPSADCQVTQDIDALVEADLPAANVRQLLLHPAMADEAGSIASELASAILEFLVVEAAAALLTSPHGQAALRIGWERRVTVA